MSPVRLLVDTSFLVLVNYGRELPRNFEVSFEKKAIGLAAIS